MKKGAYGKLWGGHSPTKRHNICVAIHDLTSLEVISDQIFGKIWRKMRLAPWKKGRMGPKLWGSHSTTKRHDICVAIHDLNPFEVISDQIFEKIWRKMRLASYGSYGSKTLRGAFPHQNTWYMCCDPWSDLFGGHFWPNLCKISRKMRLASWKKGHMAPKLWGGLSPTKIHDLRSFWVGAIKTTNLNVVNQTCYVAPEEAKSSNFSNSED